MPLRRRPVAYFGLCILIAGATVAAQPARTSAPADLDQWVARAMKTFEVPGIALAIVKNDEVVVAKGYGVRKLGEPTPVDAKTLFGIASNTKFSPSSRSACWSKRRRSNGTRRWFGISPASPCRIRT